MKTYAHKNADCEIVGIGMIYFEDGSLHPEIQARVDEIGMEPAILEYGEKVKAKSSYTTVIIATSEMPGGNGFAFDKAFRGAFKHTSGMRVDVCIDKAKIIAHDMRRAARDAEFAPHDKIVALNIPGADAIKAEAERVKIREKYKVIQAAIDAASNVGQIKSAIEGVL